MNPPNNNHSVIEKDASGERKVSFKDQNYLKTKLMPERKRTIRSLKQIISLERTLPWDKNCIHYSSIESPPSKKPNKKYSDISGLVSKYTDPITSLNYTVTEEYQLIKTLPNNIVAGLLLLKKKHEKI